MPYYHIKVLRRTSSDSSTEADFELNLSEEQTNVIAEQYENKEAIFVNGRWSKVSNVEQIEIRETPQKTDYYSPQIQLETIFLTHAFPNVTRQFIKLPPKEQDAQSQKARKPLSKDVFVVHGTDFAPVKELKAIIEEAGLIPIVLHEQASKGMTIIEKLEKYSNVGFAFIILTPDDKGFDGKGVQKLLSSFMGKQNFTQMEFEFYLTVAPSGKAEEFVRNFIALFRDRARQNVVLEFGYFMGKLNRERICCLYKGDIELPSDMQGICYVHFNNSVNEVKDMILKELREAGYEIRT